MSWRSATMIAVDAGQGLEHILAALGLEVGRLLLLEMRPTVETQATAAARDFSYSCGLELERRTFRPQVELPALVRDLDALVRSLDAPEIVWNVTGGTEVFRYACWEVARAHADVGRRHAVCWVDGGLLVCVWTEGGGWHQESRPLGRSLAFEEILSLAGCPDWHVQIGAGLPANPASPEELIADWPSAEKWSDKTERSLARLRAAFRRHVADGLGDIAFPVQLRPNSEDIAEAQKILEEWLLRRLAAVRGAPGLPIRNCLRHARVTAALEKWACGEPADPVNVLLEVVEEAAHQHAVPRAEIVVSHLRSSADKARQALKGWSTGHRERSREVLAHIQEALAHIEEVFCKAIESFLETLDIGAMVGNGDEAVTRPDVFLRQQEFRQKLMRRLHGLGFRTSAQAAAWAWSVLASGFQAVGQSPSSVQGGRRRRKVRKLARLPWSKTSGDSEGDHRRWRAELLQELVAAYLEHLDPRGFVFVDEGADVTFDVGRGIYAEADVLLATRSGRFVALEANWPWQSHGRQEWNSPFPIDWAVVVHEDEAAANPLFWNSCQARSGQHILVVPNAPEAVWEKTRLFVRTGPPEALPTVFGFLAGYVEKLRPRPSGVLRPIARLT